MLTMSQKIRQIFPVSWSFEFIEQWSQIFENCNWWTFNLFQCEFDYEIMLAPSFTFELIIFGLGFQLCWNSEEYNEEIEQLTSKFQETLDKHLNK